MVTLQREFKRLARHQKQYGRGLMFWNQESNIFTIFPSKLEKAGIFAMGVFCLISSVFFLYLIIALPEPPGEGGMAVLFSMMVIASAIFLGVGVYAIGLVKIYGATRINLRTRTFDLEKIGVFGEDDIDCITIRRNLYYERLRIYILEDIKDEELKSTTVGVRFNRKLALGRKRSDLVNYKDFKKAKNLQKTLARHFNCPTEEL